LREELFAIVETLRAFRLFVYGADGSTLFTDHKNLRYLIAQQRPHDNPRVARWIEKIWAFLPELRLSTSRVRKTKPTSRSRSRSLPPRRS